MLPKRPKMSGEKKHEKKTSLPDGPGARKKRDPEFRREIIGPKGKKSNEVDLAGVRGGATGSLRLRI